MELTLQDYANYGVIVTTADEVGGQPTLPLAYALEVADRLADYEAEHEA